MKLNANNDIAEISGGLAVHEFTIKATAKSFSILSSGLYANKIRAIVRELGTNAYDAHVAAGNSSKPFSVKLPNSLEPWFTIRDYGTGLTPQEVKQIYTTYFESTKTHSDDFVGCLGLGSKSPFSYTDNFAIVSYCNGEKWSYTAFINDQGTPGIVLLDHTTTSEPNGVEITIAVNSSEDFRKFISEVADVYSRFPVLPEVSGADYFEFKSRPEDSDIVEGIRFASGKHFSSYYNNPHAVMGNVAYPIDKKIVLNNNIPYSYLLNYDIEIDFPIGSLDIQPSREGLSYNQQTFDALAARFKQVHEDIYEYVDENLRHMPDTWDKGDLINKWLGDSIFKQATAEWLLDNPSSPVYEIKGVDETASLERRVEQLVDNGVIKHWTVSADELANKYNLVCEIIRGDAYSHRKTADTLYKAGSDFTLSISKDVNCWLVHDKTTRLTKKALAEYAETLDCRHRYAGRSYRLHVLTAANPKQPPKFKEFLEDYYSPNRVEYSSQLAQFDRATTTSATRSSPRVVVASKRSGCWVWDADREFDSYDDRVRYYLPLSSNYLDESAYGHTSVEMLLNKIDAAGLMDQTVYGIRVALKKKALQSDKWVNLEDYIKEKLASEFSNTSQGMLEAVSKHCVVKALGSRVGTFCTQVWEYVHEKLDDTSKFKPIAKILATNSSQLKSVNVAAVEWLERRYFGTTTKTEQARKLADEYLEVMDQYPLLGKLSYHANSFDALSYIKLVDSYNELAAKCAACNN